MFFPRCQKILKKLFESDRSRFERVQNTIKSLQDNPSQGKSLKHKLKGKYSQRAGAYRIIYQVDKKIVTIFTLDIGHRKDVYR